MDTIERLGAVDTTDVERMRTRMPMLDKALGGGFALPSVVQLSGQPGIGKSTLLLQIANVLSKRTLYVTSEELVSSIAERARRLNLKNIDEIRAVATLSPNETKQKIVESRADFVIVDSLQGMRLDAVDTNGVGIRKHSQLVVRDIALDLINFANKKAEYENRQGHKITFVLVCHVNRAGDIAGLKEIEHMVDVIMWFGGERSGKRRKVRLEKNRRGPADKIAVFNMEEDGLHEIKEKPEDRVL